MKIPVLECKGVTKNYKLGETTVEVLRGIDIKIFPGTYNILFGPSGCGKSTLLSLLAGLDVPTGGEILVRGESLAGLNVDQLAKYRNKKIGMVFQAFNLIPSLRLWENVSLPYVFSGEKIKIRKSRANRLLELVHMEKYFDRLPTQLSGGQQQRVAIVRSLMNNPWILLIDEPTGNLDSASADEIMEFIENLNKKSKRTILLVTHNPDYLKYAQKVIHMKDGRITEVTGSDEAPRSLAHKDDEFSEEALEKMAV